MTSPSHFRKIVFVALVLVVVGLAAVGSYFTLNKPPGPYIVTSLSSGTTTSVIQSATSSTRSTTTPLAEWIIIGQVKSIDYYLSLLEINGTSPYVQLAGELRKLPDLRNETALAQITYLALNSSDPEVKEAIDLIVKGGKANPSDFRYETPHYNTELQVLYWLASQRQFKHEDTLPLAISMSNGFWVTIGDASVQQRVRGDVVDLLDFFRETDELQQTLGYRTLEQLPLEAKVALAWLGGDTGTHGPHAITGSQTKYDSTFAKLNMRGYVWDTVNVTTLRQMRDHMKMKGWSGQSIDQSVANVEDYFFFSGFEEHFSYVASWDVKIQVNGENVPARNVNNANFNFAYYLKNGRAIGVCEDEMTLVSAFLKSWGIATLPMSAYWFAGNSYDPRNIAYSIGGNWYGGHSYTMYFDPMSERWKVFRFQIGIVFPYVRDAYIFLPPVLQNDFVPSARVPPTKAAVPFPFETGEVNTRMFAPMFNITGTYLNSFKIGVATGEMKQWVLYKIKPPAQSASFAKWDYSGPWNVIEDGSKDVVKQNGAVWGDLGQPYIDLANVSYAYMNGSIFFRFALHGNIPSTLPTNVSGIWYQILLDVDSDSKTGYHWSSDFTPDYILDFGVAHDVSSNSDWVYSELMEHCGGERDWCWGSVGFTQRFGRTPIVQGGIERNYFVLTCEYQDIMASHESVIRFFVRSGIAYDGQVYNDPAPDSGTVILSLSAPQTSYNAKGSRGLRSFCYGGTRQSNFLRL